ncbi:MAG: endolytic transglycosylase MltG [Pseudomonadota bacterium]|nr:endolytic transglycosylase MltG [Pseudomonadota bacterium]
MAVFLRKLLVFVLIVGGVGGFVLWQDYRKFSDGPMEFSGHELVLDVKLGTSFNQIVRKLSKENVSPAPRIYWRALAHEMKVLDGLRAGEYAIAPGMTPRKLLDRMAKGRVIHHQFTIIEGWRFSDLRLALTKEPLLEQTMNGLSEAEIMTRIGRVDLPAEGRFLPETYSFVRGQKDIDVLKRAFGAMQRALDKSWAERSPDSPLKSADEMLILASIVEKETGQASDRPDIAGVFLRRLKIGMKLQTDPTVIYGIGASYNGNITRRHLETDTPYNTYTRYGLPPTPIALPGAASLIAVARPAAGDTLYFVARGDGTTQFSATLQEHNTAVVKHQLRGGG